MSLITSSSPLSSSRSSPVSSSSTQWRILPFTSHTAAHNMAIDHVLLESVASGASPPTIRFYTWKPTAVSIGFFQSLYDEVDVSACRAQGIHVVRRQTGGGAVYHADELTYSIIAPESFFPSDILASYREICGLVMKGLASLNIDSSFIPINDIITSGKKISGNAQTRKHGALLQHGTILFSVDVDVMFSLLKVPNEKIKDKLIATVKERVTSVCDQSSASFDGLYLAMRNAFLSGKRWQESNLTAEELFRVQELVKSQYGSTEWTAKR